MKIALISAASALFIFGTTQAREIDLTPSAPLPAQSAPAVHRVARLEGPARVGHILCSTTYVTTTLADGTSSTRKSVNCDE
jgi:hypothetical protein